MKKLISLVMAVAMLACLSAGFGGSAFASDNGSFNQEEPALSDGTVNQDAVRVLTREDLINILTGCAILGTGGGGSLDDGIKSIDEALDAGKQFKLVDVDDLAPDALIGSPYACGAISPPTEEEQEKICPPHRGGREHLSSQYESD